MNTCTQSSPISSRRLGLRMFSARRRYADAGALSVLADPSVISWSLRRVLAVIADRELIWG